MKSVPLSSAELARLLAAVEGKRYLLDYSTRKSRLGGRAATLKQLKALGAHAAQNARDYPYPTFSLVGTQAEYLTYRPPVPLVFEEELYGELAGRWGAWKQQLFELVRTLTKHPLVWVTRVWLGPPTPAAELEALERRLGRPLPHLLREFYQEVGALRLYWLFFYPLKNPGMQLDDGKLLNPDVHDNYDGAINILPLAEVLFGKWRKPAGRYGLAPNQYLLDVYSNEHPLAVELGDEDDPWVYQGTQGGQRFDEHPPVRFSTYVRLLLASYGLKQGRRLARPAGFAVDLDNHANLLTQDDLNGALEQYGRPSEKVGSRYDELWDEERFYALLKLALAERPDFSVAAFYRYARSRNHPSSFITPALRAERFLALRPDKLRAELRQSDYGLFHPFIVNASFVSFAVVNHGAAPVLVVAYRVAMVLLLEGEEELLAEAFGAQAEVPANGPRSSLTAQARLPMRVQAGHEWNVDFRLPHPNFVSRLHFYGIKEGYDLRQRSGEVRLRLTVQLDTGAELEDEHYCQV